MTDLGSLFLALGFWLGCLAIASAYHASRGEPFSASEQEQMRRQQVCERLLRAELKDCRDTDKAIENCRKQEAYIFGED